MMKNVAKPMKIPSLPLMLSRWNISIRIHTPDQYVSFVFHHDKMSTRILMLAKECMGYQVQEDIRQEAACLHNP